MSRRQLVLNDAQRTDLDSLRDHGRPAYLRERAAALLKVAAGIPAAWVARDGLLRPREPMTVYEWLNRYQAEGIVGLTIRPGRGRKPAFSPSAGDGRAREGGPPARGAA